MRENFGSIKDPLQDHLPRPPDADNHRYISMVRWILLIAEGHMLQFDLTMRINGRIKAKCQFHTNNWLIDMGIITSIRWNALMTQVETAVPHRPSASPVQESL